MKFLLLLIAVASCLDLPSQYHTTEQINQELDNLKSQCSFIDVSDALTSPTIKQIDINKGQNKKYKGFVVFGEHAREMISPETGLHYLKDLCRNYMTQKNKRVLDNYELRMIVNANPISRSNVEKGDYCVRENENGVDINRNYDAHWKQNHDDSGQTNSGPEPFSEPETRAIRDSLKSFGPNIFLSVHSGVLGMFTPHAYSLDDAEVNDDKMVDILANLQNNHCPSCDVGSAGQTIGYLSPGSCIDYAYDELGIKYSFAFEIYSGNEDLQEELNQTKQAVSFLQVQQSPQQRKQQIREKLQKNSNVGSCFLQTQTKSKTQMDDEMCFHYFNPQDSDDYDFYVKNWSDAISDMFIDMIEEESS